MAARVSATLWVAGAGVLMVWMSQAQRLDWRQAAMAWVLAVAGLWAWRSARRQTDSELRWDGRAWQLDQAGGSLEVALDLQRCLLLRWRAAAGRSRWLWLTRSAMPQRWLELRRAVYSPASTDAPPSDVPAANP